MLTPCFRCHRHVRDGASCPFCARGPVFAGPVLSGALPALALGLTVGGLAAGGLAIEGCGSTAASTHETTPRPVEDRNTNHPGPSAPDARPVGPSPSDEPDMRDAPAYGGPPEALEPPPPPSDEPDMRTAPAYGGPSAIVRPPPPPALAPEDDQRGIAAYGGPPMPPGPEIAPH